MKKSLFYILLLWFISYATYAQTREDIDAQRIYNAAEDQYTYGHFEQALKYLQYIKGKSNKLIQSGTYRLMVLCYLEMGDIENARRYVAKLMKVDPYFTPSVSDPPRFAELIAHSKQQGQTLTTASKQAETLEEAPVPVTIITEEMIAASGAQTLRDLLCMYVPTMTRIEGMQSNISMRGVVGQSQEDILIMLDGHRLNSGATNAEAPDFRNSISKIKQIEVLRGPASSLYGNVALMSVVNIITKDAYAVDGMDLSLQGGSYGTYGTNILYGKGNHHSSTLAWGSFYSSTGEKVMKDGTPHYIDGFNHQPVTDLGFKGHYGDITLMFTHQYSKPVPFYNQITLSPYTYDDFDAIKGNKPGDSRSATNLFVDFNHSWDNLTLSASAYGNLEFSTIYNAYGDDATDISEFPLKDHPLYILAWESASAGANVNLSTSYKLGSQHGSLLFGAQANVFSLYNSSMEYDSRDIAFSQTMNGAISYHAEEIYSLYAQLKNYITPKFIINGGLRFDANHRFDESIYSLSPRIALIWTPSPTSNIKISYAHSLVDAPYIYRANLIPLYGHIVNQSPQFNDAFQLTMSKHIPSLHLRGELNLYLNQVSNLCIFSYIQLKNHDEMGGFSTANVDICGAEGILEYKDNHTFAQAVLSYKYPIEMSGYSNFKHKIGNEPAFMLNLIASERLCSSRTLGSISLRGNIHYQTSAEMEVNYIDMDKQVTNDHTPPQTMLNAGIDWQLPGKWGRHLSLALDVYNLLDNTDYRIGTQLQSWIPAQGRKFLGKVNIRF